MFGTYFGTVSFFMISMPEKNLSGVFSEPHLDFCDKCNHILHSFQYLTSAKEYKGTYSGLQIRPCLTCVSKCDNSPNFSFKGTCAILHIMFQNNLEVVRNIPNNIYSKYLRSI